MQHRRGRARSRLLVVGAITVCATVFTAFFVAVPASAREDPLFADVTSQTLSRVQKLTPKLQFADLSAWASEDYTVSPAGRYTYVVQFIETDAHAIWKKTCSLTRNGVEVSRGTCGDLYGEYNGIVLPRSGTYVIRVDGERIWRFTFTKPRTSPPPLAPALCTIDSLTPGAVTSSGQVFTLKTSGACDDGQWWWSVSGPTGQGVAVFSPRPDGQVIVNGVTASSTPVTLEFAYLPNGYRVLSAVALYGDPVVTGWTPVPQTLGY